MSRVLPVWLAVLFIASACGATYSSLGIPQGGSVPIPSPAGNLVLIMQADGNLVLYENGVPLWDSGTAGQNCSAGQCVAIFQSDGNFVVYNGSTPLWASNTGGNSGAQLVLSDQSPQIKIVGANQAVLWSIPQVVGMATGSNTGSRGMNVFTLADGQHIVYVDGSHHVHQMWYTTFSFDLEGRGLNARRRAGSRPWNAIVGFYGWRRSAHRLHQRQPARRAGMVVGRAWPMVF